MPEPIQEENPLLVPPKDREKWRRYKQGTGTVHHPSKIPTNPPPSEAIEAGAAERSDPTVERALRAALNAMGRMMSEMPDLDAQDRLIQAMEHVRQALVCVSRL